MWQEQYDLGVRYLSEGNYEEAIIAFAAAIEFDPHCIEAYQSLSDTYLAQGDTEKALEVWHLIQAGTLEEADNALFSQQARHYEELVTFLNSGEFGVRIAGISFDREAFLAGAETEFDVSVLYRSPESGESMVEFYVSGADEPNGVQSVGRGEVQGGGLITMHIVATPNCAEGNYYES